MPLVELPPYAILSRLIRPLIAQMRNRDRVEQVQDKHIHSLDVLFYLNCCDCLLVGMFTEGALKRIVQPPSPNTPNERNTLTEHNVKAVCNVFLVIGFL